MASIVGQMGMMGCVDPIDSAGPSLRRCHHVLPIGMFGIDRG